MVKFYEKGECWPSIKRLNLFAESNQTTTAYSTGKKNDNNSERIDEHFICFFWETPKNIKIKHGPGSCFIILTWSLVICIFIRNNIEIIPRKFQVTFLRFAIFLECSRSFSYFKVISISDVI